MAESSRSNRSADGDLDERIERDVVAVLRQAAGPVVLDDIRRQVMGRRIDRVVRSLVVAGRLRHLGWRTGYVLVPRKQRRPAARAAR